MHVLQLLGGNPPCPKAISSGLPVCICPDAPPACRHRKLPASSRLPWVPVFQPRRKREPMRLDAQAAFGEVAFQQRLSPALRGARVRPRPARSGAEPVRGSKAPSTRSSYAGTSGFSMIDIDRSSSAKFHHAVSVRESDDAVYAKKTLPPQVCTHGLGQQRGHRPCPQKKMLSPSTIAESAPSGTSWQEYRPARPSGLGLRVNRVRLRTPLAAIAQRAAWNWSLILRRGDHRDVADAMPASAR